MGVQIYVVGDDLVHTNWGQCRRGVYKNEILLLMLTAPMCALWEGIKGVYKYKIYIVHCAIDHAKGVIAHTFATFAEKNPTFPF